MQVGKTLSSMIRLMMSLEQNLATPQYLVRGKCLSWNLFKEHKVEGGLGCTLEFLGGWLGGLFEVLGGLFEVLGGRYFIVLTPKH